MLVALLALIMSEGPAQAQTETYTVLHSFGQGTDGANPFGGVSNATVGKSIDGFWGATENGGTYGYGTIFRLTSSGGVWTEVVAHSFSGADGESPTSAPVGAATAAYGTTSYGGNGYPGGAGYGTAYLITFSGGVYQLTSLYKFCFPIPSCPDGDSPYAGLYEVLPGQIGGATYLYGTTLNGGANGLGTIFVIDASTETETVVHSFAGGIDGAHPYGGLIECPGANNVVDYCGMTYEGGSGNVGTVFKFDPPSGTVTILHSFTGGGDGELPQGGLVADASWNLYGTTSTWGRAWLRNGL